MEFWCAVWSLSRSKSPPRAAAFCAVAFWVFFVCTQGEFGVGGSRCAVHRGRQCPQGWCRALHLCSRLTHPPHR
jgi:hypothetical protein